MASNEFSADATARLVQTRKAKAEIKAEITKLYEQVKALDAVESEIVDAEAKRIDPYPVGTKVKVPGRLRGNNTAVLAVVETVYYFALICSPSRDAAIAAEDDWGKKKLLRDDITIPDDAVVRLRARRSVKYIRKDGKPEERQAHEVSVREVRPESFEGVIESSWGPITPDMI